VRAKKERGNSFFFAHSETQELGEGRPTNKHQKGKTNTRQTEHE